MLANPFHEALSCVPTETFNRRLDKYNVKVTPEHTAKPEGHTKP